MQTHLNIKHLNKPLDSQLSLKQATTKPCLCPRQTQTSQTVDVSTFAGTSSDNLRYIMWSWNLVGDHFPVRTQLEYINHLHTLPLSANHVIGRQVTENLHPVKPDDTAH